MSNPSLTLGASSRIFKEIYELPCEWADTRTTVHSKKTPIRKIIENFHFFPNLKILNNLETDTLAPALAGPGPSLRLLAHREHLGVREGHVAEEGEPALVLEEGRGCAARKGARGG